MSDAYYFIERARLLLDQGRVNDALKQLKEALSLDPDNDEALSLYTRCQYEQNDYAGGIETIRRAIALVPDYSYYYYLLAFGYYRTDRNQLALATLEESIRLNPYFAESYALMGFVLLDDKNFKAALEKANEGLAIAADNISCLNVRATALNKLRMTDEAVETMQYALLQDPDNELTHTTVGWNYLEKGKHKLAAHHFREALRIDPNMHSAKNGLKESLKSKIPPYKWLLRYSFWINNQGKNMRWIIPLGLYFGVRILSSAFNHNKSTQVIGLLIIAAYLIFVITSWIINPIANMFLLLHKDGKYALDETEKYTAITVVSSLLAGCICLAIVLSIPFADKSWEIAFGIATFVLLVMAVPLGAIQYPLSFNGYGTQNKIAMVLSALGLLTLLLAFIYSPAALVTGVIFAGIFIVNNWLGLFRR